MVRSSDKQRDGDLPFLQAIDVVVKVALAPYMTVDPLGAVKSHVDKLLFRYDDQIGGIPLGYEDVMFTDEKGYGRIHADQPWVYVEAKISRLLTFVPKAGLVLKGRVSQVSDNHVSLLVLGLFNASIGEHRLRPRFSYNTVSNSWISKSGGKIREGEYFEFKVDSFQFFGRVINISGDLI